jgi:hypothetical protein
MKRENACYIKRITQETPPPKPLRLGQQDLRLLLRPTRVTLIIQDTSHEEMSCGLSLEVFGRAGQINDLLALSQHFLPGQVMEINIGGVGQGSYLQGRVFLPPGDFQGAAEGFLSAVIIACFLI